MQINLTLDIKPLSDNTATGWAARIWQSSSPCKVLAGAGTTGTLEFFIKSGDTSLTLNQAPDTIESLSIENATSGQLEIVNTLSVSGILNRMLVNGIPSIPIPEFTPEEAFRRYWVFSLEPGDEVDVPYSRAPADIIRMTVMKNDGGWLRLLPNGKDDRPENYVLACAVNGWTNPYGIKLERPESIVSQ